MCERQPIDVSLTRQRFSSSLSSSLPLAIKINKIFKKNPNNLAGWICSQVTVINLADHSSLSSFGTADTLKQGACGIAS